MDVSTCSRAVKGAGLKIPCFGFVGSNPTVCTKFKIPSSISSVGRALCL